MTIPASSPMTPGLASGQKLLHFEIKEQIAAGGNAIVWRGYDRLLGRHVAVKQIAVAGNVDEIFREKFRREADLQKRVSQSHPNLVQVFDFVDDPRGLFIVMELVDGITLEQLLIQLKGPIDPLKGLAVIREVATGLAAIHAAGILHRDLKPANILIPNAGAIRICDFGLAALMTEQESLEQGTTQYMAPELLSGAHADARCDLYSLGMIAYELLCGRPAFEKTFSAVMKDQRHRAMRWMKWHTNPRASAVPLIQINPQAPQALSDLVARLMSKDPAGRVASAHELLEAIKRNFTKQGLAQQQAEMVSPAAARFGVTGKSARRNPGIAGPATAPLPKKKRWPMVLAVLVILQSVGLIGYYLYDRAQRRQAAAAVEAEVETLFRSALNSYEHADYPAARGGFEKLAGENPKHEKYGTVSRGYSLMAQYQIANAGAEKLMGEAQYEQAAAQYEQINKLVAQALALPVMAQATKLQTLINQSERDTKTRRAFLDEAVNVASAVVKTDYEGARRRLNLLRRTGGDRGEIRTALEKKVLEDLGTYIEGQNANHNIDEADASAANLQAQRRLADARVELEKALKKFPSSAKLKSRLGAVVQEIEFDAAMTAGQAAENKNDLPEAVSAFQKANSIKPDKVLGETINRLRSQMALTEGLEREKAGDPPAAAAKYEQAITLWPNPAAEARLKEMKLLGDKNSILAAADSASASGDFEQAAALYDKAKKMAADPQTQAKLNEARVRHLTRQAAEQLSRNQLDAATPLVKQALEINAEDAQAKQQAVQIDNMTSFLAMMMEAASKRQASDFGAAKRLYQKAIDLAKAAGIDNAEAAQLKIDTEYDHLIAQARSYIELSQWATARGILITAQKMRNTDQVQQLLKEVEDHEPKPRK